MSEEVSQAIVKHPGLKELEVVPGCEIQGIQSILSTVTSQGCGVTSLIIGGYIDMSSVDPELLGRAVIKLERLVILGTNLKQQQLVAIFTGVREGRKMEKFDIGWNDLSGVYPGL